MLCLGLEMPWVGLDIDGCKYLVNQLQCNHRTKVDHTMYTTLYESVCPSVGWLVCLSYSPKRGGRLKGQTNEQFKFDGRIYVFPWTLILQIALVS